MNWLAFDTSTDILSVAVSRADRVWTHDSPGGAQASSDGLPTVLRLMQEAQVSWTHLQAIVMGRGPGAFTGLRTACAMAQGLAWGAGLKVLPIDTLLAVAETAHHAHPQQVGRERLLVVMDARMAQVYVAAYERVTSETNDSAAWRCVQTPALCAPETLSPPGPWAEQAYCVVGNAPVHGPALAGAPVLHAMPSAQALIRLAPHAWAQGQAVPPEQALPLYVRDKVAQTTAERDAQKLAANAVTAKT
jgi:tRNA threonylcarbamoyladenosine biosynthesis protein TsaB